MRRKILCLLLCCVLLLVQSPASGAADSSIIFLALNDTMPYSLSADTMPYWSGNVLYVHSSTFNITSLNLSASYNSGNMTLLVYSGSSKRSLTFDLSDGTVLTHNGQTKEVIAALRGESVFVPLEYVASFFGIGTTYLYSRSGWPVVRLTTGAQVWEDDYFLEKAEKLITDRAAKYQEASEPSTPSVVPPVVVPPLPSQEPIPETPNEPDPPTDDPADNPDDEPETPALPDLYPAIVGIDGALDAAEFLGERGLRAAFYFTAEDLRQSGDTVRRLYAEGHSIGVVGDLDAANAALDRILCCRTLLALDADDPGYLCDRSTAAPDALDQVSTDAPILLRIDSTSAVEVLQALLDRDCQLMLLRETTTHFRIS